MSVNIFTYPYGIVVIEESHHRDKNQCVQFSIFLRHIAGSVVHLFRLDCTDFNFDNILMKQTSILSD